MTRVFFGWGMLMLAIFLVGLLFYGFHSPDDVSLFAGVVAFMVALAGVLWVTGLGRNLAGGARALPDTSPPTVLLALAGTMAALGAVWGLWLTLIGAGAGAFAVGGLVRESRAQRRAAREARARHGDRVVTRPKERV